MIDDLVRIVGTGHVFRESAKKARKVILEEKPLVVAVELDRARYFKLMRRENSGDEESNKDVNKFSNPWTFLLSKAQEKLGNQFGMAPGGDMISAIKAANEINAEVALIDQNFQKTINYMSKAPLREKLMILREGIMILLSNGNIAQIDSESLDLNNLMNLFKQNYPYLFEKLVHERNKYMGNQILDILNNINHLKKPSIVAVVGMGHSRGIKKYLRAR